MTLLVRITDFKSIHHAEIELRPGLNILVGPNGSGKTNFFSAIKFIRDLLLHGAARAVAHAGGPKRVYRRAATAFTISVSAPYGNRIYRRRSKSSRWVWQITVTQRAPDEPPIISRESLRIIARHDDSDVTLFSFTVETPIRLQRKKRKTPQITISKEHGRDLFSSWAYQYKGIAKDNFRSRFLHTLKLESYSRRSSPDDSILRLFASLDDHIASVVDQFNRLNEYNIQPARARQAVEPRPFAEMKPDGHAVGEVIHALETKEFKRLDRDGLYHEEAYYYRALDFSPGYYYRRRRELPHGGSILDALENITKELIGGVESIDGIATELDPSTGRRFVIFKSGSDKFYPEEVSDGTIKWLCLLVSIFAPASRLFLLEEPENFLHPWMQQKLIATMRSEAKTAETIFLLTTHSATVLNAALPEEVVIVTPSSQGTQIERIPNLSEIEGILEDSHFNLGDLWTSGAISGVPTHGG